jgi:hypothetical protein
MRGAIPPLPQYAFVAWCLVKHMDNLLTYYLLCNTHEEMRNAYQILVGKSEGKRLLGRLRRRWEDNIRMDLRKTGWEGVDWIHLAQDGYQWRAVMNTVMNLRVP